MNHQMMKHKIVPLMMKKSLTSIRPGNGGGHAKSTQSTPSQPSPPKTLTRLIARQNWFELENILSSGSIDWVEIDEKGIITEDSIVHFALRYGAPLHIIKLLASRYPRCLTRADTTGKFACHVAAKYGAMPNVMEYLVYKNKHVAGVQDPQGKAPIHYVGEFYASNNEANTMEDVFENMLQVVRLLREAAPQSFNLEDNDGCNAIEYAIENDADIKVIKTMQRTARDDWRALKANGQGKRHEELEKDIERFANEARMNVVLNDVMGSSFRNSSSRSVPDSQIKSFVAKSA